MSNPNGPAGQERYRAYCTGKERPETNRTKSITTKRTMLCRERNRAGRSIPLGIYFPAVGPAGITQSRLNVI
jgi:hypothetical protein